MHVDFKFLKTLNLLVLQWITLYDKMYHSLSTLKHTQHMNHISYRYNCLKNSVQSFHSKPNNNVHGWFSFACFINFKQDWTKACHTFILFSPVGFLLSAKRNHTARQIFQPLIN